MVQCIRRRKRSGVRCAAYGSNTGNRFLLEARCFTGSVTRKQRLFGAVYVTRGTVRGGGSQYSVQRSPPVAFKVTHSLVDILFFCRRLSLCTCAQVYDFMEEAMEVLIDRFHGDLYVDRDISIRNELGFMQVRDSCRDRPGHAHRPIQLLSSSKARSSTSLKTCALRNRDANFPGVVSLGQQSGYRYRLLREIYWNLPCLWFLLLRPKEPHFACLCVAAFISFVGRQTSGRGVNNVTTAGNDGNRLRARCCGSDEYRL